jgi:hypothetical protein
LVACYATPTLFRSRAVMERRGVSRLRFGRRHTLGLIFHDAA